MPGETVIDTTRGGDGQGVARAGDAIQGRRDHARAHPQRRGQARVADRRHRRRRRGPGHEMSDILRQATAYVPTAVNCWAMPLTTVGLLGRPRSTSREIGQAERGPDRGGVGGGCHRVDTGVVVGGRRHAGRAVGLDDRGTSRQACRGTCVGAENVIRPPATGSTGLLAARSRPAGRQMPCRGPRLRRVPATGVTVKPGSGRRRCDRAVQREPALVGRDAAAGARAVAG